MESETKLSCAGLLFKRQRRLSPEELTLLGRRIWIRRVRGSIALILVPIALGLPWWIVPFATKEGLSEWVRTSAMLLGCLCIPFGLPFLVWLGQTDWRKATKLKSDWQKGFVNRFEGCLDQPDPEEQENIPSYTNRLQEHLLKVKLLSRNYESEQFLETYPNSQAIYQINNRVLGRWTRAEFIEIASAGYRGFSATVLSARVAQQGNENLDVRRRNMTEAERKELQEHIHLLRRRGLGWSVFVCLMISGQAFGFSFDKHPIYAPWFVRVFLLAGIASFITAYARRLYRASRFSKDLEIGWILLPTQIKLKEEIKTGFVEGQWEFLSVSGYPWTVDGKPAPWRLAIQQVR